MVSYKVQFVLTVYYTFVTPTCIKDVNQLSRIFSQAKGFVVAITLKVTNAHCVYCLMWYSNSRLLVK